MVIHGFQVQIIRGLANLGIGGGLGRRRLGSRRGFRGLPGRRGRGRLGAAGARVGREPAGRQLALGVPPALRVEGQPAAPGATLPGAAPGPGPLSPPAHNASRPRAENPPGPACGGRPGGGREELRRAQLDVLIGHHAPPEVQGQGRVIARLGHEDEPDLVGLQLLGRGCKWAGYPCLIPRL